MYSSYVCQGVVLCGQTDLCHTCHSCLRSPSWYVQVTWTEKTVQFSDNGGCDKRAGRNSNIISRFSACSLRRVMDNVDEIVACSICVTKWWCFLMLNYILIDSWTSFVSAYIIMSFHRRHTVTGVETLLWRLLWGGRALYSATDSSRTICWTLCTFSRLLETSAAPRATLAFIRTEVCVETATHHLSAHGLYMRPQTSDVMGWYHCSWQIIFILLWEQISALRFKNSLCIFLDHKKGS